MASQIEPSMFPAVIDAFPTEVAVLDSAGVIIFVNRAWRDRGDADGLDWPDHGVGRDYLLHVDEGDPDAKECVELLREVIAGDRDSFTVEYACFTPLQPAWFTMRAAAFELTGSRYIVVMHDDITPRILAEQHARGLAQTAQQMLANLRRAHTELEAFSYTVSHDLKAPLREIGVLCEALGVRQGELTAEDHDRIDRIRRDGQHATDLVAALLDLSRIGYTDVERVDVDLSVVAHEIVEEMKSRNGPRVVIVPDGIRAECDPRWVRVLLVNLLSNAWKVTAGMQEARIEFGVDRTGSGPAVYFVKDNGVGFEQIDAERIFAPFERLHAGRFRGFGIGLATVRRVVDRHGGRVWAEGRPGAGATFFFTLAPDERSDD